MEIKVSHNKGKHLRVAIKGIDAGMANALRRIVHGEIPAMAVDYADIVDNSSGLVDEVLVHRLGMIPLKWPKGYNLPADCKCGSRGCSSCEVKFKLDKQGPCIVCAGDMQSDDKDVKPDDEKTPIVELLDGQKVKLTAVAKLGFGKDHVKHQAAVVGYGKKAGSFEFTIESVCGLSGEQVFSQALEILEKRAEEFAKLVRKEL